jgi:hypothetical protein
MRFFASLRMTELVVFILLQEAHMEATFRKILILIKYETKATFLEAKAGCVVQPRANRTVSSGAITITGRNIGAENICFRLKQTKQCLIRGVSFHFKEPLSEVGRVFSSRRNKRFWVGDRETERYCDIRLFLLPTMSQI